MHGIYFYGHNEPTLGLCLFEKIEGNQKEKKRTKKRKKKSKQRKKKKATAFILFAVFVILI